MVTLLKAAAVMLALAVPPIWPYGYYMLLRLVVCGVAAFSAHQIRRTSPGMSSGLVIMALLFNPVIPVFLPRALWIPIDLVGAVVFWRLAMRLQQS